MYRNKLIQWGLLVVFIALVVGLNFHTQDTQLIFSIKAASQRMPTGDLSVVGKPSLPAATVDAILKSLGSPMRGTGQVVARASQRTNIDDAFALAVWWTETNDGAAGVGLADRNPGSVRGSVGYPSAYDGYTIYPSYSAAIVYWFNMLKNMYVNRGLSTVYLISHPYVGTSSSPLWAGKVVALMMKYRGEAPPPSIVVQHGKKVAGPRAKAQTSAISLARQGQTGEASKQTANTTRQLKTPAVLPLSIEYTIVVFALLLALAKNLYLISFPYLLHITSTPLLPLMRLHQSQARTSPYTALSYCLLYLYLREQCLLNHLLLPGRVGVRQGCSVAMEKYNRSNTLFVSNRYLAFFLYILII